MPNILDGNGLQIKTTTEIVADITTALQGIYGADINVDSNSPDGQMINIFAQAAEDQLELLVDVYNSMSIEASYGTQLDQRVALNGLARLQGTFTTTFVDITVDQALNLIGLDALPGDPTAQVFTIKDSADNQWQLVLSTVFGGAGTQTLQFQAMQLGAVEVTANTINEQVTVVLGVTDVNNPTTSGTVVGTNEESDAQLKIRHAKMFYFASTGPADSVAAALLSVDGVLDAFVFENDTGSVVNTVNAHSIWCIVRGGADADIAQAIYSKKMPGCGLKGSVSSVVTRPHGNTFTAQWDVAITEDLYIQFGAVARSGTLPSAATMKTALAGALVYRLGDIATIGDVVAAMLALFPNVYLTGVGVSDDGFIFADAITPTTSAHYFTVSVANITIT